MGTAEHKLRLNQGSVLGFSGVRLGLLSPRDLPVLDTQCVLSSAAELWTLNTTFGNGAIAHFPCFPPTCEEVTVQGGKSN